MESRLTFNAILIKGSNMALWLWQETENFDSIASQSNKNINKFQILFGKHTQGSL